MSQPPDTFLVVNGWTIFAHPLFLDQIDDLLKQVDAFRQKDPTGYVRKNASKRLAAIIKLAFEIIPQDPGRVEYRQGNALGDEHKHWFRAKFFQQYRLFFRYHAQSKIIVYAWQSKIIVYAWQSKIIVYAWVNDEDTKRAYESGNDAYRVFNKMLKNGHPPDDWDSLMAEAKLDASRLQSVIEHS